MNPSSVPALISTKDHPRISIPPITYINSDKFVIGRGYEATLKILDKAVSRKHCTLEKSPSFGWMITSHCRSVEINGVLLAMDQSKIIKCGDRMNLAGVCSFLFKCSPDENRECCCDRTQGNVELVDLSSEASSPQNSTAIPSLLSSSSSLNVSNVTSTTLSTQHDVSLEKPSSLSSDIKAGPDLTDNTVTPEYSDLLKQVHAYMSDVDESDNADKDSIVNLKENFYYLKQLHEFNKRYDETTDDLSKDALLPKLLSFCKANYRKLESCSLTGNSDARLRNISLNVNMLLKEHMERFMFIVIDQFETSFPSPGRSSDISKSEEKEQTESVSEANILEKKPEDTNGKLRDELNYFKQNSEWQEARIQYLEMKLKERDKMEKELETVREENEGLEKQLGEIRTKLSKMEVLELELSYLKETTKYKEDDKRNKDELEKQIETLTADLKQKKDEVEKITIAKSVLESEKMSLQQKCEEIEKKLNTKVGCSSNQATGEYCCDLFSSLKDNVLEALEKEFTCCICNEMFVGATVTNCNHVFCGTCLKEWKKKKKQCPFCRAALTTEHRPTVIDECITNILKCISDKLFAERMQMIEDRKSTGTPPPAKRARRGRGSGTVQHAQMPVPAITVRNHTYPGPGQVNIQYAHQNFVMDLINLT